MKQTSKNRPTQKLIQKATFEILNPDTREAWIKSDQKFHPFTTSQYTSGEKMIGHGQALPLYIVMASLICMSYFHGHNDGNFLLLVGVEIPRVLKDFTNIRTKNLINRQKLVRDFLGQMVKGTHLPSQALILAKSNVQLAEPSSLTQEKPKPKKKKQTNSNNNGYFPHFCKGPNQCTNKSCSFYSRFRG